MHWRRWFLEWLVMLVWLGLLPVVASAIYYAAKKSPDFDSTLKSRSLSAISPTSDLTWAVRIGGRSYKFGIVSHATNFGVNPEDRNSEQLAHRVGAGELSATYQATYIARFRGATLPTIVCVFRDVTPDGKNLYEVQAHGSRPIGIYMLYIALASAGILSFFKIAGQVAKRKTVTAEPRLPR
jgi:hypothetical protein